MDRDSILNLNHFFSICHQLVLDAGLFIKEAYEKNDVIVMKKPSGEVYTNYDLKIQTFYVEALSRIWPKLKIIGEEDQIYDKPIDYDYDKLNAAPLSPKLLEGLEQTAIDLDKNKVILWIDPIDGTSEFVRRHMDNVVTLLGISINGEAKVGLVGRYYNKTDGDEYKWNPQCFFSYADYPHLYVLDYLDQGSIREITLKEEQKKENLTCAILDFDSGENLGLVQDLTDILKIGGCESLTIVEGKCDFHVYRGDEYMKWDLCAGEALLKSLGGTTTDPFGKEFSYLEDKETWQCSEGYLLCRSKEVLKTALKMINVIN